MKSNRSRLILVGITMAFAMMSQSASAQDGVLDGSATQKHRFSYEQRIELAKKFLEPIRLKATTDLDSDERKHFFTKHWAVIDPAWTAKFILENPVPQDDNIQERILYDNDALRALMARPAELDESVLLKLLESDEATFMVGHFVTTVIENLPPEKVAFKEKLIAIATKEFGEKQPLSPMYFGSTMKLAKMSSDPKVLERIEDRIAEFYESGDAAKMWKQMKKSPHFRTNREYYQSMCSRFAPESHRGQFGAKSNSLSANDIHVLVHDESIPIELKREKLNQVKEYSFGSQPHEQMPAASALGKVATIDCGLAMKWAELAPDDQVSVWAKLAIAPALARKDPDAARQLVKECYEQIVMLDASSRNQYNYNFSPTLLAARGLRVVEYVDASLLLECIDKTIGTIDSLESSRMNSAKDHIFYTIAAIAHYDRAKAEKLFEKHADDVAIGVSGPFFRALMALHPEQVWDEYQEMPEKDNRGIDFRIYVRNELLPALTKKSEKSFWQHLNSPGLLAIDPIVFSSE